MRRFALIAALVIVACVADINAEVVVTLDSASGTGPVDAGVVGASFDWTPEQLQAESGALGFVFAEEQAFTASCNDVPTTQITDRIDYILEFYEQRDANGTLQAFVLTGLSRAVGRPSLPVVGSECGQGSSVSPQVWTSAEEDREDRLSVAYRGLQVRLWPGSAPGMLREPVDEQRAISTP